MRASLAAIGLVVLLGACGGGERAAFIESKCRAVAGIERAYEGCVEVAGRTYDELQAQR